MTGEEYTQTIVNHLHDAYMLTDEKVAEVLPRFLDTLLTHLEKLDHPLQTNNLDELGKVGHTLKGALLNLGLADLADIAYGIEQQCKVGNTTADYQGMAQQLQEKIRSFTVR